METRTLHYVADVGGRADHGEWLGIMRVLMHDAL